MSKKQRKKENSIRINEGIRAPELRVLIEGREAQIMSREAALALAEEMEMDLIEISANATPPVAKITDYGKHVYNQKKKQKEIKAKQHTVEVKNVQIRPATGEGALKLKAKMADNWLKDGQRVKLELYLRGRSKYMDKKFLHDRLGRVLSLITEPYKIVEDYKQSPKGIAILIEADKKKQKERKTTLEREKNLSNDEEKEVL